MVANFSIIDDQVTVTANIDVDMAVTTSNNKVLFMICQDGRHGQTNMLVDILPIEDFTLADVGEFTEISKTFTMDSAWNEENLRIIVLVQSYSSKEILQSTLALPDYRGTLTIDCIPDNVEAGWTLTGPQDMVVTGNGDKELNLFFTGDFTLVWDDIPFWTSPAVNPNYQTLVEGGEITFTGEYSNGPFLSDISGPLSDTGNGQGISLIDFDNDGHIDMHIVNDGSADQLLRNNGDGTFVEVFDPLINDTGAGRSAAWADMNNDGNLDVYLGKYNEANVLLLGDGSGSFSIIVGSGYDSDDPTVGVSWVDFDLDGILDIYVVNENTNNQLLRGWGDLGGGYFIFGSVSGIESVGGPCSSASWGDANNDGRLDMYITKKHSPNVFLTNSELGFSDRTDPCGLGFVARGMSSAWGDFNNDGNLDLYITNEGNADKLYRSNGDYGFTLVSGPNLGDMGRGRHVNWVDFNNDGFLDLFINRNNQTDLLMLGDGTGAFNRLPLGSDAAPSNSSSCGDVNGDGYVDVVVSREGEPNILLLNGLGTYSNNNWLQVCLTGVEDNQNGIGSRVELTANGVTQTRLILAGSGYLSMNTLSADFGVGTATMVDLVITWPNGTVQTVSGTGVNHILNVVQGVDPASPAADTTPAATALFGAVPNPFNPSTTIEYALAADSEVNIDVYTIDGRFVKTLVNGTMSAGPHGAIWDGTDHSGKPVASGTYFYRLSTGAGFAKTGRMALVK